MSSSRPLTRSLTLLAAVSILTAATHSAVGQAPASNPPRDSAAETEARAELRMGVNSYKSARYDEAIEHFQKAVDLDPDLPLAKTYLGVSLAQNVIPGLDTPDNMKTAQQSIDIFKQVLAKDPHDVNTMKQIAGVFFNVKRLDDARTWQMKVLAEDPKDPEAAYTVGVIDWSQAYQNAAKALSSVGLHDDGQGNTKAPANVRETIKAQNGALVEEAIHYLGQAIENRPGYSDAMVYLNLVYRRKADLEVGDEAARKDDVKKADEWIVKGMDARKAEEEHVSAQPDAPQQ